MDGLNLPLDRLDFDFWERVRLARDPAYDGVIFIGVTSTRICCRPVCRVRQPLSKNVRYFPSAAAAEAAGFRPCLRLPSRDCRPLAGLAGVRATVDRAMRLIEEGALDKAGVDALAARLGVGARHLSRLFRNYLGSSPLAVARAAGEAADRRHQPQYDRNRRPVRIRQPAQLQRHLPRGLSLCAQRSQVEASGQRDRLYAECLVIQQHFLAGNPLIPKC